MKIKMTSSFEACPDYTGKGICVDVTPLRKQPGQYGERDVFKLVFEVDLNREDGGRYGVWSRNFTPSLNEKANLRKFLRSWFGRDLTETELEDFDTECLIGKPAQLVVINEHREGEVYANIVACTPDRSGSPLKASGKHVRAKDRQAGTAANGAGAQGDSDKENKGGGNRRAEQTEASAPDEVDHWAVKIHVGRCKGMEFRELIQDQIKALIEHWVPMIHASAKLSADDRRLLAALQWWEMANDECPF